MSNANSRELGKLTPGDQLVARQYTPSLPQVFMFSAVTWNRHLIHYSKDQAISEGHDDVPVQRGLIGNFFTRYVVELFDHCFITQLSWKVVSTTYPGQTLTCDGIVKSVSSTEHGEVFELELKLQNAERVISTAVMTAQV
jgi:hydroxyacyl-ACP dehydratase HTD2-like protein with hotdog domain